MSAMFRPVQELWGESCDMYISTEMLIDILEAIADETVPKDNPSSYSRVFRMVRTSVSGLLMARSSWILSPAIDSALHGYAMRSSTWSQKK